MPRDASSVFIVNLDTGEYMLADHYALRERGMPGGHREADGVSTQQWLDAIAKASGNAPRPMSRAASYEDTLVDLSSGRSTTQEKAQTQHLGIEGGWTDLDCVDTPDFLDALRSLHGLGPCDRAYLGFEAAADDDETPSAPSP